jgi:hypothetical protein
MSGAAMRHVDNRVQSAHLFWRADIPRPARSGISPDSRG